MIDDKTSFSFFFQAEDGIRDRLVTAVLTCALPIYIYVLEQSFPVAMPGANFLSGGQTLPQAAARLSAMNKIKGKGPW